MEPTPMAYSIAATQVFDDAFSINFRSDDDKGAMMIKGVARIVAGLAIYYLAAIAGMFVNGIGAGVKLIFAVVCHVTGNNILDHTSEDFFLDFKKHIIYGVYDAAATYLAYIAIPIYVLLNKFSITLNQRLVEKIEVTLPALDRDPPFYLLPSAPPSLAVLPGTLDEVLSEASSGDVSGSEFGSDEHEESASRSYPPPAMAEASAYIAKASEDEDSLPPPERVAHRREHSRRHVDGDCPE
jgi:hypothetical protein